MSESPARPLAGKVAVVTGASRGMGKGIAVVLAEQGQCLVGRGHAARNRQVFRIGQRQFGIEQLGPGPAHQALPHLADQDQGSIVEMPDLEQLPDHRHLEQCPDAPWGDHERV